MNYTQTIEWKEGKPFKCGWYLVACNSTADNGKSLRITDWAYYNGVNWWDKTFEKSPINSITHYATPPTPPKL